MERSLVSLQIIDAAALYSHKGAAQGFSLVFAAVEFVWAITSLVVVFRVKHKPTRLLASVFFGYNVLGWVLSMFIMRPHCADRSSDGIRHFLRPFWFGLLLQFDLCRIKALTMKGVLLRERSGASKHAIG